MKLTPRLYAFATILLAAIAFVAINIAADSPKLAQLMSQITRYAPESVFPTIAGWPELSTFTR